IGHDNAWAHARERERSSAPSVHGPIEIRSSLISENKAAHGSWNVQGDARISHEIECAEICAVPGAICDDAATPIIRIGPTAAVLIDPGSAGCANRGSSDHQQKQDSKGKLPNRPGLRSLIDSHTPFEDPLINT